MNTDFEGMPELIYSRLSCGVERDDHVLEVQIYRLEGRSTWRLEVVNEGGTSIVWNSPFSSDYDAYDAFHEKIELEGIEAFLDDGDIGSAPSFLQARLH